MNSFAKKVFFSAPYQLIGIATGTTCGLSKTFRIFEQSKNIQDENYDALEEAEIHAAAWTSGVAVGTGVYFAWPILAAKFAFENIKKKN